MTRKRQRFSGGKWDALPWQTVGADVSKDADFDDCMFFSLEQVDGDVYQQYVTSGPSQPPKQKPAAEKKQQRKAAEAPADEFEDAEEADDNDDDDVDAFEEPDVDEEADEADESEQDEELREPLVEPIGKASHKRRLSIRELRELNKAAAKSAESDKKPAASKMPIEKQPRKEEKQPSKDAKARKEPKEAREAKETKAAQTKPTEQAKKAHAAQAAAVEASKPATTPATKASRPHTAKASWGGVDLHPAIVEALVNMQFTAPTPVQRDTIPHVITFQKDLIAAAETGSGKTLAYALPVIQSLVARWDEVRECEAANYRPLFSLIVTPTRELALQVLAHINAVVQQLPEEYKIRAMTIVGGMAEQKQKRLLKTKPHIIIATPGRLWEFIESREPYVDDMSRLQFFIIDEADRMAEEGAFMELSKIIKHMQKCEALAKEVWKTKKSRKALQREKEQAELERMYDFRDEKVALQDSVDPRGYDATTIAFEGGEVTVNDEELLPAEFPVQMLTNDILARLETARQLPPIAYNEDEPEAEEEEVEEDPHGEQEDEGDEQLGSGFNHPEDGEPEEEEAGEDNDPWLTMPLSRRQTLLFSATMMVASTAASANLKNKKKDKRNKNPGPQGFLRDLMKTVGLRGNPAVIDMTAKRAAADEESAAKFSEGKASGAAGDAASAGAEVQPKNSAKPGLLPPTLVVAEVICTPEEKDTFTYYILHKFSGRTLIFSNSIDGVKKITNFLMTLRLPAKALHAQMQQRQRLKTMDFFRGNENAILVATDVAARGLDFPDVQHVLHYDIPRSAQIYIHRSGRTARANKSGIAISLVSPLDSKYHREICTELGVSSLPTFPVDLTVLGPVRDRARLAVQISKQAGAAAKEQKSKSWLKGLAQAAELDVDEDVLEAPAATTKNKKVIQLRAQLNDLLQQPLVVKKRKFIDVAAELQAMRDTPARAEEVVLNKRKKAKTVTPTTTTATA